MSSSSGSVYDLEEFTEELVFQEEVELIDNTKTIIDDDMLESEISYLLVSYHPNRKEYSHVRALKQRSINYIDMMKRRRNEHDLDPANLVPVVSMHKKLFPDRKEKEHLEMLYEYDRIEEQHMSTFLVHLGNLLNSDHIGSRQHNNHMYALLCPFKPDATIEPYHLKKSKDSIYLWQDQEHYETARFLGEQQKRDPGEKMGYVEYEGDPISVVGFINKVYDGVPNLKTINRFNYNEYVEHLKSLKTGSRVEVYPHAGDSVTGTVQDNNNGILEVKAGGVTYMIDTGANVCDHPTFMYGESWSGYKYYKSKLVVDEILFIAAPHHVRMMKLTPEEHVHAVQTHALNSSYQNWDQVRKLIPGIDDSTVAPKRLTQLFKAAGKLCVAKKSKVISKKKKSAKTNISSYLQQVKLPEHVTDTDLMRLYSLFQDSYNYILYNIPRARGDVKQAQAVSTSIKPGKTVSLVKPPTGTLFTSYEEMSRSPPKTKDAKAHIDIGRFYQPLVATKELEWKTQGNLIPKENQVLHHHDKEYNGMRQKPRPQFVDRGFFTDHELDTDPALCIKYHQENVKRLLDNAKRLDQIIAGDNLIIKTRGDYRPPNERQLEFVNHVDYNGYHGDEEYIDFEQLQNNDEGYGKRFHDVVEEEEEMGEIEQGESDADSLLVKIGNLLKLKIAKKEYDFLKKTLDLYVPIKPYQEEEQQLMQNPPDRIQRLMQTSKLNKEAFADFKRKEIHKSVMERFYVDQSLYIFSLLVILVQIKLPEPIIDINLQACKDKRSLDGFPLTDKRTGGITEYVAALMQFLAKKKVQLGGHEVFAKYNKPLATVQAELQECITRIITDKDVLRMKLVLAKAAVQELRDQERREVKESTWLLYNEGPQFKPFIKPINTVHNRTKEVKYIVSIIEKIKSEPPLKLGAERVPMYANACCMQQIGDDIKLYSPMKKQKSPVKNSYPISNIRRRVAVVAAKKSVEKQLKFSNAQMLKLPVASPAQNSTQMLITLFSNSPIVYNKAAVPSLFELEQSNWANMSKWVESKVGELQFALQQKRVNINCFTTIITNLLFNPTEARIKMAERFLLSDFFGTLSKIANNWKAYDLTDNRGLDAEKIQEAFAKDPSYAMLKEIDTDGFSYANMSLLLAEAGKLARFEKIEAPFNRAVLITYIMALVLEWIIYLVHKDDLKYNPGTEALVTVIQQSKQSVVALKETVKMIEILCMLYNNKQFYNFTSYETIRDTYEYQRESKKRSIMTKLEKLPREERMMLKQLQKLGLKDWDKDLTDVAEGGEAPAVDHTLKDDDYDDDDN